MEYEEAAKIVAQVQANYDQVYAMHVDCVTDLNAHEKELRNAGDIAHADRVRLYITDLNELALDAKTYLDGILLDLDNLKTQGGNNGTF